MTFRGAPGRLIGLLIGIVFAPAFIVRDYRSDDVTLTAVHLGYLLLSIVYWAWAVILVAISV